MELLLNVEDGEAVLRAGAERMDDEECEDESVLVGAGANGIDRVMEAMGIAVADPKPFELIGRFQGQPQWQARHAALIAIGQVVEFVEDRGHVNELANLLLQHVEHPHPRVRYMAYQGLGLMAEDQSPHFQDEWHERVMPVFMAGMDDPIERVAECTLVAFGKFAGDLDKSLIAPYVDGFTGKLVVKWQATRHRGRREECISSIAHIAKQLEKDFSRYYDAVMPVIQQFAAQATGEKEELLRGRAFECMSFLGAAVGKERFFADAQGTLSVMMRAPLAEDGPQRECIKESSERTGECFKKDFAPFLPALLPGIVKSLVLEEAAVPKSSAFGAEDNEDDVFQVKLGDGKIMKVKTEKFEELELSLETLQSFCANSEGAYFDWVPPTAEAVLPTLAARDQLSLSLQVRGAAFALWAQLVKVATTGAAERGAAMASRARSC